MAEVIAEVTSGSVTVTGTGSASAPPDVAVIDVAAEVSAAHASEALELAGAALTRMRDAALSGGVQPADLATSGTQLWPETDQRGRPNGYRAMLSMTVRSREIRSVSDLLPALIAAGGDAGRLHNIRLEFSDPASLASTARERAFADARARAQQYADLAGRGLGEVVLVEEGGSPGGGPSPVFRMAAVVSESVPVEPGMQSVSASVTVRWGLG